MSKRKKTEHTRAAAFDLEKNRISIRRDGVGLAFGMALFLVIGALLSTTVTGFVDAELALRWANIATIIFTSFTVGGIIFPHWKSDIAHLGQNRIDDLLATATNRAPSNTTRRWWQLWGHKKPQAILTAGEKAEIASIRSVLKHNERVIEKVEKATFTFFCLAVVSGGAAIICELRLVFAPS